MNNLELGIAAYKAGKRDEARQYFIAAVNDNPFNEQAWGWMYQTSNNDNERVECLKKVVSINPQNVQAKKLLDDLHKPPLTAPPVVAQVAKQAPPQIIIQQKNNSTRYILAAAISLVLVFCCLFALVNTPTPTSPSTFGQLPSSNNSVRYILSGSANVVTATYFNESGGMEQADVNLPFQYDMTVGAGAMLSLVATINGSGSVTCEIWVNGERVKEATSTADYGTVTCSDFTIR